MKPAKYHIDQYLTTACFGNVIVVDVYYSPTSGRIAYRVKLLDDDTELVAEDEDLIAPGE